MKRICLLAAIIFITAAPGFAQEKIIFSTLDWPPYIGQELENYGYVGELITEAFSRKGIEVEIRFYPWARAKNLAEHGKVDAYGPEYYAAELDQQFLFSAPFPGGPAGLFRLVGSGITYSTLADLMPYRIGVVRGYVNEANFDAASYLNKEEAVDDLTNIKKLLGNRINLFFSDKLVVEYLAKEEGLDASQIELMKTMVQHDLYLAFPRRNSDSLAKKRAFDAGLKEMTEDGTLQEIMTKHGF